MSDNVSEAEAIASAVEETVKEAGGAPEPEKETVEAPEPTKQEAQPDEEEEEKAAAEEEPKAEEKPEEEEEDENPFALSAEQLKQINESELLSQAYKSMQRGLTKKTQGLSQQVKGNEQALQLVEWIKENPDAAVEQMAQMRGYVLSKKDAGQAKQSEVQEAASDAVDALMEKYSQQLGPESTKLLLPMMQEVARTVAEQALAPVAQQTQFLDQAAKQRGISAAVHEFGSYIKEQGEDWNDNIQEKMAVMMDRVTPGDNTTIQDYLFTVYNAVTAEETRQKAVKSQLARLKKAQAEAEPNRSMRPAPKQERHVTVDMDERDAIALAVELAEREAAAR